MRYSSLSDQTPSQRENFTMNQGNNTENVNNNLMNQQPNMEEARYYDMGRRAEQNVVSEFFNNSQNPVATNQIPHGMNQNLINKPHAETNNFIEQMENRDGIGHFQSGKPQERKQVYSELTGGYMNSNEFKHNNMVPFYKKRTQNTETFQNQNVENKSCTLFDQIVSTNKLLINCCWNCWSPLPQFWCPFWSVQPCWFCICWLLPLPSQFCCCI